MVGKREIKKIVFNILSNDKKARDSDAYLYLEVVRAIKPALLYQPLMIAFVDKDLPNYESVRRSRQKMQETFPLLKPSDDVQAMRDLQEDEYREVFAHGLD